MRYYVPKRLTEREEQVIAFRREGMAGKEIGNLLGIHSKTVFEYQRRAISKLGVRTVKGAMDKINVMRFRQAHNV